MSKLILMPRHMPALLWFCLFTLPFALVSPAAAQPISQSVTAGDVKVTLSVEPTDVKVGESLVLSILMENIGIAAPVELSSRFHFPEGNDIHVIVQPPGELPYRYEGALDVATYSALPVKVSPGMPIKRTMPLQFDRRQSNGFLFPAPGRYGIAVKFQFRLRGLQDVYTVTLPETAITVSSQEGKAAEAQVALSPAAVRSLQTGAVDNVRTLDNLKNIISDFGDTTFGAQAMKAVGFHYVYGVQPDHKQGAEVLTRLLKQHPELYDADSVAYGIAAGWHFSGNLDAARQWIFYLHDQYPQSDLMRPEDALARFYYFAPEEYANVFPWFMLETPWKVPGVPAPKDLTAKPVD